MPADPVDGSYARVACNRISATEIRYNCYDHFRTRMDNYSTDPTLRTRQYIDAGGTTIGIYSGPDYFFVDSERATRECFGLVRANLSPYSKYTQCMSLLLCTIGPRNYAGSLTGNWMSWAGRQPDATTYTDNIDVCTYRPYSANVLRKHVSGAYVCRPANFLSYTTLYGFTTGVSYGRCPNAIVVDDNLAFGATLTAIIDDDGNTGVFQVVGLPATNQGKLAVRAS